MWIGLSISLNSCWACPRFNVSVEKPLDSLSLTRGKLLSEIVLLSVLLWDSHCFINGEGWKCTEEEWKFSFPLLWLSRISCTLSATEKSFPVFFSVLFRIFGVFSCHFPLGLFISKRKKPQQQQLNKQHAIPFPNALSQGREHKPESVLLYE